MILGNSFDWHNPKDVFIALLLRLISNIAEFEDVRKHMIEVVYKNPKFKAFFDVYHTEEDFKTLCNHL